MTGFVGGFATGSELASLAGKLYQEPWYQTRRTADRDAGLALIDHGTQDSAANLLWQGNSELAVIYGVLSNTGDAPADLNDLVPALLANPRAILPELEGPFALAAVDTGSSRVVLATDKAGSRPIFYVDGVPFVFASEVKALISYCEEPSVDVAAVADMLQMGWVVGPKTLVSGVDNLPPATVLVYEDGETTVQQYWRPSFDRYPTTEYPDSWLSAFVESVDDVAETVEEQLSLWLSGGIDSRVAAGALARTGHSFDTLTYRNGTGRDPDIAAAVADCLNAEHTLVETESPDGFVTGVQRAIDVTDGLMAWSSFVNLSTAFSGIYERADVVMEGGTFMGEDIWSHALRSEDAPAIVLRNKKRNLPTARVKDLLTAPVDPLNSLRAEVDATGRDSPRQQTLHGMRRLYAYSHMRSNVVQRSQVGTRVLSHGAVLDAAVGIPDALRMKTVPGTRGRVPAGVPKLKLAVTRRLNNGLERIRYDRSNCPPAAPYLAHVAGFGLTELFDRLVDSDGHRYRDWYRTNATVRSFIDDTIEEAAERPFLNGAVVRELRSEIRGGSRDSIAPLAALTAVELWLQRYLDSARNVPA